MPFLIKENRNIIADQINDSIIEDFKTQLIELINEILNKEIPFTEKV